MRCLETSTKRLPTQSDTKRDKMRVKQELTTLRERVYELEKYKKLVEGELHHIEFDIKKCTSSKKLDIIVWSNLQKKC